jgi:hypothetical protein
MGWQGSFFAGLFFYSISVRQRNLTHIIRV